MRDTGLLLLRRVDALFSTLGEGTMGVPELAGGLNWPWDEVTFDAVLNAAPDAILSVDAGGTIRFVNAAAGRLFGGDARSLVGRLVEELLPERFRQHVAQGADVLANPGPGPMAPMLDLCAIRLDGTEVPVDVSLSTAHTAAGVITMAFVHDASERKQAERTEILLRQREDKRLLALEMNDNIVQGLVAAKMTLESGEPESTAKVITEMLVVVRARVDEMLREAGHEAIKAGDLMLQQPAHVLPSGESLRIAEHRVEPGLHPVRVLIVDDVPDLRFLLRIQLEPELDMMVIGEAGDGAEAIERAEELRPDVVLLDLAMPVMDGVEALPELRRCAPGARIIVISGFGADRMGPQLLALGASAYVEKGLPTQDLLAVIRAATGRARQH